MSVESGRFDVEGFDFMVVGSGSAGSVASVMPKIPSANTNAPSMMIGEFAATLAAQR
jgi:choline dehydrogenase-like flavoprotein